jgi:hypothetical protein
MFLAIFEDRPGRMERMAVFDLHKRPEVRIFTGPDLTSIEQGFQTGEAKVLTEFTCIAAHRSALKEQSIAALKDFCKTNSKPLIFFSGNITSGIFLNPGYPFLLINSKDFYSGNLQLFIEASIGGQKLNLLILQFGRRWKLSLLLDLRNRVVVAVNRGGVIRLSELNINPLIMTDLIDDSIRGLLTGNPYGAISPGQIEMLLARINHLINEAA